MYSESSSYNISLGLSLGRESILRTVTLGAIINRIQCKGLVFRDFAYTKFHSCFAMAD